MKPTDLHSQADADRLEQAAELLYQVAVGRKQWQPGFKHDPTLNAASPPYAHGNGGLFSTPGQEPTIFATVIQPMQDVASAIPVMPQGSAAPEDPEFGGYTSPLFTTITGVTSEGAVTEPDGICDDQPNGGLLKACTLTAPFGRVGRGFKLDIDTIGTLVNRGESTDLRLMNPVARNNAPFQMPSGAPTGQGTAFQYEFQKRFMIAAVQMQRKMAGMTWDGTPTNNSANGGYKEFPGLNTFIAAGNKVDAINGTPCPSMDADIKDFGYDLVNGSGRDIVQYVDMMYFFLTYNAEAMGLAPARIELAMRLELFDELVKVWPVRYYQEALVQMANFTNGRVMIAANETTNMRDDMRNNRFLPIRGERVRVRIDSSIAEKNSTNTAGIPAGQYASDIYFIPFTVLGNIPVTWWEFFNQANAQAEAVASFGGQPTDTWTTDGGMFRWFKRFKNGCYEWDFVTKPRLILRTPFLSGRIQNVRYNPLQHVRQWNPNDPYFVNGGRTNAPVSSYYTEYSTSTPVEL